MDSRATLTALAMVIAAIVRVLVSVSMTLTGPHVSLGSIRQVVVVSVCVGVAALTASYLSKKPLAFVLFGGSLATVFLVLDAYLNTAIRFPHLLSLITPSDWAVQAVTAGIVGFASLFLTARTADYVVLKTRA